MEEIKKALEQIAKAIESNKSVASVTVTIRLKPEQSHKAESE